MSNPIQFNLPEYTLHGYTYIDDLIYNNPSALQARLEK